MKLMLCFLAHISHVNGRLRPSLERRIIEARLERALSWPAGLRAFGAFTASIAIRSLFYGACFTPQSLCPICSDAEHVEGLSLNFHISMQNHLAQSQDLWSPFTRCSEQQLVKA